MLLGTKSDLVVPLDKPLPVIPKATTPPLHYSACPGVPSRQAIPTAEIEEYAARHNMLYMTCSAKDNINIDRLFATCVRMQWLFEAKYGSVAKVKPKPSGRCNVQ
jgi:hypothetical protein